MNKIKNALNKLANTQKGFLANCNAEINTKNTQLIICFGQKKSK